MIEINSVSYSHRGVQVVTVDRYPQGVEVSYQNYLEKLGGRNAVVASRVLPPVSRLAKLVDVRKSRWGLRGQTQFSFEWSDEMSVEDPGTLTVTCDGCGETEDMDTESWGVDDVTIDGSGWSRLGNQTFCPKCKEDAETEANAADDGDNC